MLEWEVLAYIFLVGLVDLMKKESLFLCMNCKLQSIERHMLKVMKSS